MKWMTLAHVHLDRVATPWLIRRHVDADAEFLFVEWDEEPVPADGVQLFGFPGIALGLHDEAGTLFAKVLRAYGLDDDPALVRLERIVAAGVRRALGHLPTPDESDEETRLGAALDVFGQGLGMVYDDHDHIEHAIPLYEALYAWFRWQSLPAEDQRLAPASPPDRALHIRKVLRAQDLESAGGRGTVGRAGRR